MIPVVRFKSSVQLKGTPALARLLWALQAVVDEMQRDLEVSCGTEAHTEGAHPTGEAIDISVKGLDAFEIVTVYRELSRKLGPLFYVQIEAPPSHGITDQPLLDALHTSPKATALHIHVQRKAGTVYPPQDATS